MRQHVESRDGRATITLSHHTKPGGEKMAKEKKGAAHTKPSKKPKHGNNHHPQAKVARVTRHGTKPGKVKLLPGGKLMKQGVMEMPTPTYLISTDIATNVGGGVEATVDADGKLTFTADGTVIYALPLDGLQALEASASLDPDGLEASLTAHLHSVAGIEPSISVTSDGDLALEIDGHGVKSTITLKPEGEIEVDTTVKRDIQGQGVVLSATTTFTPRKGVKEPASQPAKQPVRQPAPATKHATATVTSPIVAERNAARKADKPVKINPRFGPIPPIVPAPGFAAVDAIDPETAQVILDYAVASVVSFFEGLGSDAAETG